MKKQDAKNKSIKVKTNVKAGAIGRGTRGTASQASTRTELL